MRTSFYSALLLLSGSIALAGCGGGGEDVTSSTSSAVCTNANIPAPCPRGSTCVGPANDSRRFPETGITVRGAFLDYMNQTGGTEGTGLPLSNVWKSVSSDGKSHYTQCFERQVLEYHEENTGQCRYTVLGRQLGKDRYQRKYGSSGAPGQSKTFAPTPIPLSPDAHCFEQSRFCIEPVMYDWWVRTGGLDVNGYPISNYFEEDSPEEPGKRYTVQYFERTVGEYHARADGGFDVDGQLLGKYAPECPNVGPRSGVKTTLVSARSAGVIPASWWTTSTLGGRQSIAAFALDGSLVVRLTQSKDGEGHDGMDVFPSHRPSGEAYRATDVAKILAAYSNDNEDIDVWECLGAIAHVFLSGASAVIECKDAVETGDATFCSNELEAFPNDVAEVAKSCWSDRDPTARGTRASCGLLDNGIFATVGENCNGDLSCTCYVVD